MAFKTVQDLSADVTISLGGFNKKLRTENPTTVEGYFLGSRTVADNKKKSGLSYIHIFQTPKGNLGVWGKTDMDRKLLGVPPGVMTRVSFDKMVPTPNGDMYKYQVELDEENTVEVLGTPQSAPAPSDDDTSYSDTYAKSYSAQFEEDEDEEPVAAKPPPANRQAETTALLKRKVTHAKK